MTTGITAIYEVEDLGNTPARVNRKTGDLYINRKLWKDLDKDTRLFILLHEAGHVDQDTRDEIKADDYAFRRYANSGKPLTKSIQALTRLLHFNNPQHFDRLSAQVNRAFTYDYELNKNPKADPAAMQAALYPENNSNASMINEIFDQNYNFDGDQYSDFLFFGSKAKREQKKLEKAALKGKMERARLGIPETPITNTTTGTQPVPVIDATKIIQPAMIQQPPAQSANPFSNKKNLYIIAAAVLVIIIALFFFKK